LAFGAASKLERRLTLRKIFDELDADGSGELTIDELQDAIENNDFMASFFANKATSIPQLFARMDTDGNGLIDWEEFMTFLWDMENTADISVTEADLLIENNQTSLNKTLDRARKQAKLGLKSWEQLEDEYKNEYVPKREDVWPEVEEDSVDMYGRNLISTQKMAMEVDPDTHPGSISILEMELTDPRVIMAPSNKLFVKSVSDPVVLVSQLMQRKGLDASFQPILSYHVSHTIVRACEKEINLIQQAKNECKEQLEMVGKLILEAEVKQFELKERARRAMFMARLTLSQAGLAPPASSPLM
jgi:hypothetical protein